MCKPYVNYLGKRNKKIVVTECLEPSQGKANCGGLWKCLCDCGNTKNVKGYQIINIDSCGCAVKERIEELSKSLRKYSERTINKRYKTHVIGAKIRNMLPMPKEEWLKLVFLPCQYCGSYDVRNEFRGNRYKHTLITVSKEEIEKYELKMNGIDRVDSKLGYIEGNCVPCCYKCNCMKRNYSLEEFLVRIKRVYEHAKIVIERFEAQKSQK